MTSHKIFEKCRKIKLVITDVDGVLTDGGMYYSKVGEIMKKFNAKDGMAVDLLLKNNIKTILLTSESSTIVKKRGKKINAAMTIIGAKNKKSHLKLICKKFDVSPQQIAYIGDDLNDYQIIQLVGLSATPSDGITILQKVVDYVCKTSGGNGAFREFVELILEESNN